MFTGIVEEIGIIEEVRQTGGGVILRVAAPSSAKALKINQSVAINGVCQTVVRNDGGRFEVEAVEETMKKTMFGKLTAGDKVNLELPVRVNDRLDGHIVLGHVDTVGTITSIEQRQSSTMVSIDISPEFFRYIIRVGSISIDGVSLTIAEVRDHSAIVSIIRHTMDHTIFKWYKVGSVVNIEFDVIGKYIERFMNPYGHADPPIFFSEDDLKNLGY